MIGLLHKYNTALCPLFEVFFKYVIVGLLRFNVVSEEPYCSLF
jgi:hypothetical protein